MPVILEVGKHGEANLDCVARPILKNKTKQNKIKHGHLVKGD